jgi:hypothetical protein
MREGLAQDVILENGGIQAALGVEQDGLAKAFPKIAIFAFEVAGGAEVSEWPILSPF